MLAHAHSAGRLDAPSVCLGFENPNRLVSLWDIVNQFDLWRYTTLVSRLQMAETALEQIVKERGGGADLQNFAETNAVILRDAEQFAKENEFKESADFIHGCVRTIERGRHNDASSIRASVEHCKSLFMALRRNPTTYPKGQLSQRSGLG
jgi:hypothetical protein